jgi:hypothetical protein
MRFSSLDARPDGTPRNRPVLPVLLTALVFFNAVLMFLLEPMVGQLLLPLLGGAPVVWNTCLVFFQMILLAGYAAAHEASTRLSPRLQLILYLAFQPMALLVLPLHLSDVVPSSGLPEHSPVLWLLGLLLVLIGVPFFIVAVTGPLLQKWFAGSGHAAASDPYYLYAAGNAGSLLALLSYPLLNWQFPHLGLSWQCRVWAVGYGVLVSLVIVVLMYLLPRQGRSAGKTLTPPINSRPEAPTVKRRLRWVALACLPSSLMLGVTTYFSSDIAPMPLLWVIPLALYLLTFTLVFARRVLVPRRLVSRALPLVTLPLVLLLAAPDVQPPLPVAVLLHLGGFFVAALFCHGLLAADRPAPAYLTDFYLWLAVGGVLGGLFNALLAPLLFNEAVEYPLVLVLICLTRWYDPARQGNRRIGWLDLLAPLGLFAMNATAIVALQDRTGWPMQLRVTLFLGLPVLLCYFLIDRPVAFALGLAAVLVAGRLYVGDQGRPLFTTRSYFGVLHVTTDRAGRFHQLVHGRTIHGRQSLDPDKRRDPLSYYHHSGPAGSLFRVTQKRFPGARVGVIGLGAGDLAGYARDGEQWTFYEIDPAVEQIAANPAFFTFLTDCPASHRVVLGDGRLRLREAADGAYDVLIVDAFSSDAIPTHLLTREAVRDYLRTLSPDGLLVLHISNRYLDLKPVVGNLAVDAGLVARYQRTSFLLPEEVEDGADPAEWVVLVRQTSALGPIVQSARWEPLHPVPDQAVWADDSSSLLSTVTTHLFEWGLEK